MAKLNLNLSQITSALVPERTYCYGVVMNLVCCSSDSEVFLCKWLKS